MTPEEYRQETETNIKKLTDCWNKLEQTFFIDKKDFLFGSGETILTRENLAEIIQRFVKNPDKTSKKTQEKLEKQFGSTNDSVKKLILHAYFIYYLFAHDITPKGKLITLEMWNLGTITEDVELQGISSIGSGAYHIYDYIVFVIGLLDKILSNNTNQSNIKKLIEDYSKSDKRIIGNALLFVSNPNYYERVLSNKHKEKIVKYYSYLINNEPGHDNWDINKRIFEIKQKLKERDKDEWVDFYADKYENEWKNDTQPAKENIKKLNDANSSEVNEKMATYNQTNFPLNTIFFGPPGTGKTYLTVERAVKIIDGKIPLTQDGKPDRRQIQQRFKDLKNDGQIKMVTFHQNYAYEDFIEGIRPDVDDESNKKDIFYVRKDGIFKDIADKAQDNINLSDKKESIDINKLINTFADDASQNIEDGNPVQISERNGNAVYISECHFNNSTGKIKSFVVNGDHIASQRLSAKIIARDFTDFKNNKIKSYQDIKPTYESKNAHHGNARHFYNLYIQLDIFLNNNLKSIIKRKQEKKNFVLIIDEINRGNIAKIFGELITLIEDSKRLGNNDELKLQLPYSQEPFGVPNNLYIIGTMNTADRSIALLDTALRRRFVFEEMMPDIEPLRDNVAGINLQTLLTSINTRITALYDREHQIGHAYFCDVKDLDGLKKTFQNKVIPLLQEYFYDDWEKIKLILNHNGFITSDEVVVGGNKTNIYRVISDSDIKWKRPARYIKICNDDVNTEETDENNEENSDGDSE